ncbi:MAG: hypothetical protein E7559_04375 [Ruminococcaceae bacterium]|nr:hypothetical protein [Oscillospiraceae bacterium]
MVKKRKTLPDNMQGIIDSGDIQAFSEALDRCEVGATTGRATTCNILSFRRLTPEHIRYIIASGIDLNSDCGYGMPSAAFQAENPENLRILVEAGADVNTFGRWGETPLHRYCGLCKPVAIAALIEHGADVNCDTKNGRGTPLDYLLSRCSNIDLPNALEAARLLLDAGAMTTEHTKGYVRSLGENFEFHRANFSTEAIDETGMTLVEKTSAALDGLYALFDVPPVPRRVMHDGVSPITVKETTWQKQHQELWDMLVPGSGKAATVQGEQIRLVGKLLYEILDNGGCNWCNDHRKMLRAMERYFLMADGLGKELTKESIRICKTVSPRSDEKTLERLNELTVMWVLANPQPIKLGETDYRR